MNHHDYKPSEDPTDGANQYGDEVYRYAVFGEHVRKKQ